MNIWQVKGLEVCKAFESWHPILTTHSTTTCNYFTICTIKLQITYGIQMKQGFKQTIIKSKGFGQKKIKCNLQHCPKS
jgi:hypothetical protein